MLETLLFVLFAGATAAFVSRPFWGDRAHSVAEDPRVAALEAARDHKFREIRDAETDLATGKLTNEDFDRISTELRGEAADILKQLDEAKERPQGA
jgi:hypothetical protein